MTTKDSYVLHNGRQCINRPAIEQENHLQLNDQHCDPCMTSDRPWIEGFADIYPPHSYKKILISRIVTVGHPLKASKPRASSFKLLKKVGDDFAKGKAAFQHNSGRNFCGIQVADV